MSNAELARKAREYKKNIEAKEQKAKEANAGSKWIPNRFIVTDPGWTGSIEQADWLNQGGVDDRRELSRRKYKTPV